MNFHAKSSRLIGFFLVFFSLLVLLKMLLHLLLVFIVSIEKFLSFLICLPLYIMYLFSLPTFKIFSSLLVLSNLIMMYHDGVFFLFLVLGAHWLWICGFSILITTCPVNCDISHFGWNMHYSKTFVSSRDYSLYSFQVVPSPHSRHFLTSMCWSVSKHLKTQRYLYKPALWIGLSPLWFSAMQTLVFPDAGKPLGSVSIFPSHTAA